MQYLIAIAQLMFWIVLLIFTVMFFRKVVSFLDGLAKKFDIECCLDGIDLEHLIRKTNRKKKEHSICRKIKERRGKFERMERRE